MMVWTLVRQLVACRRALAFPIASCTWLCQHSSWSTSTLSSQALVEHLMNVPEPIWWKSGRGKLVHQVKWTHLNLDRSACEL